MVILAVSQMVAGLRGQTNTYTWGDRFFEEGKLRSTMARRKRDKVDTSLIITESRISQPTKCAQGLDLYTENSGLSNKRQKNIEEKS